MHQLPQEVSEKIPALVAAAERKTSAELKVVVLRYCWIDIHTKAKSLFRKHGLHLTKARNAAMILLVLANREFLVYGDEGIHQKVGEGFWTGVRDVMQRELQAGKMLEGLAAGIQLIGDQLAVHFPRDVHDSNEVPDQVVHDEG